MLIFVCLTSLPLGNHTSLILLSQVNLLRTHDSSGSNPNGSNCSQNNCQLIIQEKVNGMRPPTKLSEGHLLVRLILLGVRLPHRDSLNINEARQRQIQELRIKNYIISQTLRSSQARNWFIHLDLLLRRDRICLFYFSSFLKQFELNFCLPLTLKKF